MTALNLYFILILDSVGVGLFILLCCLLIAVLIIGVGYAEELFSSDESELKAKRTFKCCIGGAFFCLFLLVALPSTKQAAIMYVLPKIAANEDVQQLPAELVQLARKKVAELLKEEEKK